MFAGFIFLWVFFLGLLPELVAQESLVSGSIDSSIHSMEKRVQLRPNDFFGHAALGKLYYRKGRQTGAVRYYQDAESALQKGLELRPDEQSTKLDLATVYAALHRFQEGLRLVESMAEKHPENPEILAVQADLLLETGAYEKAGAVQRKLTEIIPDQPALLARQAQLEELHGELLSALKLIQRAVMQANKESLRPEIRAWYHARLADLYFHTGRLADAEKEFRHSLEVFPDYYVALAGLANVHEANGKIQVAIRLNEKIADITEAPSAFVKLGDLYSGLSNSEKASEYYDTAEKILTRSELEQSIFSRELVYFYSNREKNLKTALEIAARDLSTRKDIGGYDALAWAHYKNGQYQAAEKAMLEALKLQTKEPDFYVHAAFIFRASGRLEESKRYASAARKMWPLLVADDLSALAK